MKIYQFPIIITQDENGLLMAQAPTLPGCHTQAKDLTTLNQRMKEAIELYLEVRKKQKRTVSREKFLGIHQVEIAA